MHSKLFPIAVLTAVVAVCSAACPFTKTTVSGRFAPMAPICAGQLLLNESFDTLRPALWQHEMRLRGAGGEFSWYTNSKRNTFIQKGVLNIRATLTTDAIPDLTNCTIRVKKCTGSGSDCLQICSVNNPAPPVQSARLNTRGTFNFKYGRVEIRAQQPTGDWLWPALWFMPELSVYGGWPFSGEIDLSESRGNAKLRRNGVNIGNERFESTLHFGTNRANDAWRTANYGQNTVPGEGYNRAFHLYGLEWTPDHLKFSLDGHVIGTVETGDGYYKRGRFSGQNPWHSGGPDAPFDREFYIILNVAAGGTSGYFADNVGGKPWTNAAPYAMRDFWLGRDQWLSTWNTDPRAPMNTALRVDSVKVFAL